MTRTSACSCGRPVLLAEWMEVTQQAGTDAGPACLQVKGNVYKNKRVLTEAIHRQKAEKQREKNIADQFEARRSKNKQTRERKLARREERLSMVRARAGVARVQGVGWLEVLLLILWPAARSTCPWQAPVLAWGWRCCCSCRDHLCWREAGGAAAHPLV